jgi:predicted nuclease of predicted toxin-antitoxin system
MLELSSSFVAIEITSRSCCFRWVDSWAFAYPTVSSTRLTGGVCHNKTVALRACLMNYQHLFLLEMDSAEPTLRERDEDITIWEYARQQNYTKITRDSDYNDLSLVRGFPPKVIWIRRGNCSTHDIANMLRAATADIQEFFQNPDLGILTLR